MTPIFSFNTGGRFPSDLQIPRARATSDGARSSNTSSEPDRGTAEVGGLLAPSHAAYAQADYDPYRLDGVTAGTRPTTSSSYAWDNSRERGSYFGTSVYPPPPSQQEASTLSGNEVPTNTDPAVAVLPVVGMAAIAGESHPSERQPTVTSPAPEIPEKSDLRSNPPSEHGSAQVSPLLTASVGPKDVADLSPVSAMTPVQEDVLGGLEREGAHETGTFPRIVKHDTSLSVSRLHVPGTYPKQE